MNLVDSHCHLDFITFDDDRNLVIDRAQQAGVTRIVNPAIDLASSMTVNKLADSFEMVFSAVGVHPNSASSWRDDTPESLEKQARHPKVVAIGEIGLDYYRNAAPREQQRIIFRRQLQLAKITGLPVIIHSRDENAQDSQATRDILDTLAEWQQELRNENHPLGERPGVLHSYSGRLEFGLQAMELNFLIGITGPVTFQNATGIRRMAAEIPLEKILIETDAPFLTPHPYRGKRNEPAYVRLVADKIAEVHGISSEIVADKTTQNARRLFNW
jgi:TatD DNase family protein